MMSEKEKYIEHLISLFLSGDTSLEQEQELSDYFAHTADVPSRWEPVRQMMSYFDSGMPRRRSFTPRRTILVSLTRAAAVAAVILTVAAVVRWALTTSSPPEPPTPLVAEEDVYIGDSVNAAADTVPVALPLNDRKSRSKYIADKPKQKVSLPHRSKIDEQHPAIDSGVVRAEQGQIELEMQELTAERIIVEKERQQMQQDRNITIAVVRDSREEVKQLTPRPVPVVFK